MAVHITRALEVSLNFELDAICAVNNIGAAAVHFLAGHCAKIDQKAELIVDVALLHIHVLSLELFFHEEAADLVPNIPTFNAVVVKHVRRAVYRDADFLDVRKDVFFLNLLSQQCTVLQTVIVSLSKIFFAR